jgi:tRNA-2-methylthio-N6-dimethylallyladenosine synthase
MKEIIENVKLVENAPLEEPARQYYFMENAKEYVAKMSEELGRPLVAAIQTFGCQMNARDSEKLLGILEKVGYVEGTDEETADFVIYNTCTVRENANLRVYGRLGQLGAMKKKNPHKMIALCRNRKLSKS